MDYQRIVNKVAEELNLPVKFVDKVYKAYWRAIREKLEELPLKDDITEEKFKNLRTNINIASLGKLNCTYDCFLGQKRKLEYIKLLKEKHDNKED